MKRTQTAADVNFREHNGDDLFKHHFKGRLSSVYRKKQLIYTEGHHPATLFYIQKGMVKTFKTNEEGKELVLALYSKGDYLGYTALLQEAPYEEAAEAIEESIITMIPGKEFEDQLYNHRDIMKQFLKLMARQMAVNEQRLLGLAYGSVRKKVAEALLMLHFKCRKSSGLSSPMDISRENLASIAGTATESLIRTLSDFKSEKLIDVVEGRILLMNELKLGRLIN
ncbi:Crp/Fnr family transcriptional regulator [Paraflavitalea soli]|uniref:Crp/Fnr family transcriptional regulator n=1 Tax=Paraflavitalea soli TaxID=2315862 RepID=A0A3B7MHW7_9BACT|nr:Crp/Fnr family transcriptional regulator [Paraflavitalea soli]AXY72770.1 Crp/Fnr family transcriptional regulator [Paraflavitalea soli]